MKKRRAPIAQAPPDTQIVRTIADQTEKNRKKKLRKRLRNNMVDGDEASSTSTQTSSSSTSASSSCTSLDSSPASSCSSSLALTTTPPSPLSPPISAQPEPHGSHFLKKHKTVINDEWQTTQEAWGQIAPFLSRFRNSVVWMPFYYDGKCGEYLTGLGFSKVVHTNQDFFERAKDQKFIKSVSLILDNPPYSGAELKAKILTTLVALKKPFILLLPSSVLFSQLFRETLSTNLVQLIIPKRVNVRKTGDEAVPFKYLVWLCHGVNLPQDLMWV